MPRACPTVSCKGRKLVRSTGIGRCGGRRCVGCRTIGGAGPPQKCRERNRSAFCTGCVAAPPFLLCSLVCPRHHAPPPTVVSTSDRCTWRSTVGRLGTTDGFGVARPGLDGIRSSVGGFYECRNLLGGETSGWSLFGGGCQSSSYTGGQSGRNQSLWGPHVLQQRTGAVRSAGVFSKPCASPLLGPGRFGDPGELLRAWRVRAGSACSSVPGARSARPVGGGRSLAFARSSDRGFS